MIRMLAALALALALPTLTHAADLAPREGWQVMPTAQSYADLNTHLEAAIKSAKMGLVTSASASVGARTQNVTIPGNRVVGVYRNDFARRMLSADLAAGIEAPIRFYVTENADHTATLSYKTPTFVFTPYFADGGDDLRKLATELDGIFATIAKDATTPK